MRVKVCPSCKTLNHYKRDDCGERECSYIFKGEEEGAWKPIKFDTLSTILSTEEISNEICALSKTSKPPKYSRGRIEYLFKNLMLCILGTILGIFLFHIVWPFFKHTAAGIPAAILFWFCGLGITIACPIMFIISLWKFIRGPLITTPEQTIKTFFSEGVLCFPENFGEAWSCLTPSARDKFKGLEEFKEYWWMTEKYFKGETPYMLGISLEKTDLQNTKSWNISHEISISTIEITKREDNSCLSNFSFLIVQKRKTSHTSKPGGYI